MKNLILGLVLLIPLHTLADSDIQEAATKAFKATPILIGVAKCESSFTQFNHDGSIKLGYPDPYDIGVMQINVIYWLGVAGQLGYDIYSVDGNLAFGGYLYRHYGLSPWKASKPCWDKKIPSWG